MAIKAETITLGDLFGMNPEKDHLSAGSSNVYFKCRCLGSVN